MFHLYLSGGKHDNIKLESPGKVHLSCSCTIHLTWEKGYGIYIKNENEYSVHTVILLYILHMTYLVTVQPCLVTFTHGKCCNLCTRTLYWISELDITELLLLSSSYIWYDIENECWIAQSVPICRRKNCTATHFWHCWNWMYSTLTLVHLGHTDMAHSITWSWAHVLVRHVKEYFHFMSIQEKWKVKWKFPTF